MGEPDTTTTVFPRAILDREPLSALQRRLSRDYLLHHFRRLGGDAAVLSSFLGVSRRQLYRKLERSGISLSRAKRGSGEDDVPTERLRDGVKSVQGPA